MHQIGQQLQIAVRRHYQDTKIPGTGAWECLRLDDEPGARRRHGGNGEPGQGLNFYLSPHCIISDKYEA